MSFHLNGSRRMRRHGRVRAYVAPARRFTPSTPGWSYFATTVNGDGTETLLAQSFLDGVQPT